MLFLLFGSSASGKTTVLDALRGCLPRLAVHDFDEIEVPVGADTSWRHEANERWLLRALDYQKAGTDLLLGAQTPLGELLASPSAARLDGFAACLLDCDDEARVERLRARGEAWLESAGGSLVDHVAWGAWMRGHAADRRHMEHVIRVQATEGELDWARLDDVEWRVHTIDTSALPPDGVAAEVAAWIERERA